MTAQTAEVKPTAPQTLPQFLTLLVKGMLKRLPLKLALAGGIALLAWIIHTYLLVVANEGFNPGLNPWLDRILALEDRTFTGALVWTLAAGLVTSTIARVITHGFGSTIRSVIDTPRYIWDWANELGIRAIPFLIIGYFSSIFLGFFINNWLLIVLMWLVVLGILIARHTSILLTILRLGWSDAQRLAKRERPTPFKLAWPGMYFTGVLIGLPAILPGGLILPIVCGCLGFLLVILISAGLFVRSQGGTERLIGKKVLLWILPPALLLLFTAVSPAFADDGGWQEAGGTFSGWIDSPGAGRAVLMGFLPAAGAGLGVLFGTALGSMVSIIGAAGLPAAVSSVKSTVVTAAPPTTSPTGSTPPPPSRTADHQVEGFGQQEQPARKEFDWVDKSDEGPLESRTADHQTGPFQQQEKADPGALSERHRPGEPAQTTAGVSEGSAGPRSERAGHDAAPEPGRTGDAAVETGTGGRDVRGVDRQAAPDTGHPDTGPGSGSAAEAAGDAAGLEGDDSPAGQMSAERHRPDAGDSTEGPLAERHQPGGLDEQAAEPEPAELEQPGMKAERHTPEAESGGPTAERHDPEADGGPLAARHDPEAAETGGEMRARRAPADDAGPSAERHTAAETFEGPAPLHERHQPPSDPGIPIPPVPVPAYALDWELVVVRTLEGSGVELKQTFELGERTRIGRHGTIDLKLLDPKVSRQHADIVIEGSACRIIDLNSSNGTFVNGRRITESTDLKHGDAIKIGDTYFVVQQKAE